MKFALRASVAVGLLVGVYVLGIGLAVAMVWAVVALVQHGAGGYGLIKLGPLVLFAVIAVLAALFGRSNKSSEPPGLLLDKLDQLRLHREVRRIARVVGTRQPDEIRLLPDVNAAVSEDSRWLGLRPGARRMFIGVPLLFGLSTAQLESVLAHELGHYSGKHTALGGVTYRGKERIARLITELGPSSVLGRLMSWYGRLYYAVSHRVSRSQELEADKFSAQIAGRDTAIAALREIAPLTAAWSEFLRGYASLGYDDQLRPRDLFHGFAQYLAAPPTKAGMARLREEQPEPERSIYDSHPPVSARVAAMHDLPPGEPDTSAPAFDLLADPERALREFQEWMFADSDLAEADWDTLVGAAGLRSVRDRSDALLSAAAEHGIPATWRALLGPLREGRGGLLVEGLGGDLDDESRRRLAGSLLGDLAAYQLTERGARFAMTWTGEWPLRSAEGDLLDPWGATVPAATSPAGVATLEEWLHAHRIDLDAQIRTSASARTAPEDAAGPDNRLLGAMAPVSGARLRSVFVFDHGLVLRRPDGKDRRIISTSFFGADAGTKMIDRWAQDGYDAIVSGPKAAVIEWDDVARVDLRNRKLLPSGLKVTTHSGLTRHIRLTRETKAVGVTFDAMAHYLGDRFVVTG